MLRHSKIKIPIDSSGLAFHCTVMIVVSLFRYNNYKVAMSKIRRQLNLLLLTIAFLGALSGCSSHHPSFSSVAEKGILPVSRTNPFMGANVFLAHEMEESNYLYSFMRKEGAPSAIRITGRSFTSSTLELFYLQRLEMYRATLQPDLVLGIREWMVQGPFTIDRATYQKLQGLEQTSGGVFEIFGKREVLDGQLHPTPTRTIQPVFVPTPKPKKRIRAVSKGTKKESSGDTSSSATSTALENPINFDQQALFEARKKMTPVAKSTEASTQTKIDSALKEAVKSQ